MIRFNSNGKIDQTKNSKAHNILVMFYFNGNPEQMFESMSHQLSSKSFSITSRDQPTILHLHSFLLQHFGKDDVVITWDVTTTAGWH